MCQCARERGARTVIVVGRNPEKSESVRRNGATHTLLFTGETAAGILEINGGAGSDLFLDAAGHQSVFEAGLGYLRVGGKAAIYGAPQGFAYRLPLGAVGGDFSVHYLSPTDDTFNAETCRRISAGRIKTESIQTHTWHDLESLPRALGEQSAGKVLKGMVLISPRPD